MTGYGEAHHHSESLSLSIELRALNNRYLKVSLRAPEPYNLLESEFEKVVRRTIRRGTIQVHVRCQRQFAAHDFQINATALKSYLAQLKSVTGESGSGLIGHVLALPGVVPEPGSAVFDFEAEWPLIERVLEQALQKLQMMRQDEGRAMEQELLQNRDQIAQELEKIRGKTPGVVV